MVATNYDLLREAVRERVDGLQKMYIEEGQKLQEELLSRIEESEKNEILTELKRLNDRMTRLEAKLPEPETEE